MDIEDTHRRVALRGGDWTAGLACPEWCRDEWVGGGLSKLRSQVMMVATRGVRTGFWVSGELCTLGQMGESFCAITVFM